MNSCHCNDLTTTHWSVTFFYICNINSMMDVVGYYIHIYIVALIPILCITFWLISVIMGSNIMWYSMDILSLLILIIDEYDPFVTSCCCCLQSMADSIMYDPCSTMPSTICHQQRRVRSVDYNLSYDNYNPWPTMTMPRQIPCDQRIILLRNDMHVKTLMAIRTRASSESLSDMWGVAWT